MTEGCESGLIDYRNRFDLYRMVYETRNMELRLFWERANYFLALNTAIALGYFTIDSSHYFARLLLCLFGVVVSILWVRTNLGSKFWQARWEYRLKRAEVELRPPIILFSDEWDVIIMDAKEGLGNRRKNWIDRLVNRMILTKPSVTRAMISLSVCAIVFWLMATGMVTIPCLGK